MLLWLVGCSVAFVPTHTTWVTSKHYDAPLAEPAKHQVTATVSRGAVAMSTPKRRKSSAQKQSSKAPTKRFVSPSSANTGEDMQQQQHEVANLREQLSRATQKVDELRAMNRRLRTAIEPTRKRVRGLRKVSSDPLVFTIDDFVDVETCAQLLDGSGSAMWQLLQQEDDASKAQVRSLRVRLQTLDLLCALPDRTDRTSSPSRGSSPLLRSWRASSSKGSGASTTGFASTTPTRPMARTLSPTPMACTWTPITRPGSVL